MMADLKKKSTAIWKLGKKMKKIDSPSNKAQKRVVNIDATAIQAPPAAPKKKKPAKAKLAARAKTLLPMRQFSKFTLSFYAPRLG